MHQYQSATYGIVSCPKLLYISNFFGCTMYVSHDLLIGSYPTICLVFNLPTLFPSDGHTTFSCFEFTLHSWVPMHHLSHSITSLSLLCCCYFATFAQNVEFCFVHFSTQSAHRCLYLFFRIIFVPCRWHPVFSCDQHSFSFFLWASILSLSVGVFVACHLLSSYEFQLAVITSTAIVIIII